MTIPNLDKTRLFRELMQIVVDNMDSVGELRVEYAEEYNVTDDEWGEFEKKFDGMFEEIKNTNFE